MRNVSKIIFGAILIVVGFLFLGNNYGWFSFDLSFRELSNWWPVLIIIAGIGVFLTPTKSVGNPLTVICLAFAIPFAIYNLASKGKDRITQKLENKFEEEFFDDGSGNFNDDDFSYNEESEGDRKIQEFAVENELGLQKAKLDFGGGAAQFRLETTDSQLFYAKTMLTNGGYRLESDTKSKTKEIVFEMMNQNKDGNSINFDTETEFDNNVYLKMNPKIDWEVELGIGAGDLDFDFSKFKVEKLKIETGAASVNVKLSDLKENVSVDVKSGVAKVKLSVPESVGCRIKLDGAMNSKTFDGFTKKSSGVWESSNYGTAKKRVEIELQSGLSSINVSRY